MFQGNNLSIKPLQSILLRFQAVEPNIHVYGADGGMGN